MSCPTTAENGTWIWDGSCDCANPLTTYTDCHSCEQISHGFTESCSFGWCPTLGDNGQCLFGNGSTWRGATWLISRSLEPECVCCLACTGKPGGGGVCVRVCVCVCVRVCVCACVRVL